MKKSKHILDEFSLIEACVSEWPATHRDVILGPGDDAAWLARPKNDLFLTTDMLVENVHFRRDWMSSEEIGFKAMRVNISDIAAMGGKPRFALVSLGLPKNAKTKEVTQLYRGFADACRELEIDIIGGDTNLAKEWIINITLLGERSEGKVLTRAGARVGDDIYVTGHLGDSALGLWLLKNKKEGSRFIRQHFEPPCRISVGQKLARTWGVSSMMDISDGLQGDLEHILKASHVSAQIIPNQLPLNPHYMLRCREEKIDPFTLAMTGGEDYELLFTVSPRVKLPYKIDGIPLTKIGKIIPFNPNQKKLKSHGYRHF